MKVSSITIIQHLNHCPSLIINYLDSQLNLFLTLDITQSINQQSLLQQKSTTQFQKSSSLFHPTNPMKLYLSENCYKWLVDLKILKAYIVPQQSLNHILQQKQQHSPEQSPKRYELCYDDQIYLENGYLIGVLLKEILKEHQLYSEKLLKIRKITVLKKQENWDIVREVLQFLQYPFNENQEDSAGPIDLNTIQNIIEFLYNDYGPFAQHRKNKNQRYFHIDPSRLHPLYEKSRLNLHLDGVSAYSFPNCNNLLEYTCFVIHKSFNYELKIDECMGLLVDRGKYLKAIIVKGIAKSKNSQNQDSSMEPFNRFEKIETLYQQILNSIDIFEDLLVHEPTHLEQFMQIFITGVLSQSQNVAQLTGLLIEAIQNQSWFKTTAVKVMVRSQWPQILSLLIDKSKRFFQEVFNHSLEELFVYEEDFLTFIIKFLPVLSKSMYCKEVLESLPLSYFIQKSTQTFDPDNVGSSQPKIRQLCRQVLTILFKNFFKKLPEIERSRASIAFETNPYYGLNISLYQTFSLLGNLFELIKTFLMNEDSTVQKYFRIAVRYLKAKETDVKQMVIENLKELYFTMKKSFPLGGFLTAYEQIVCAKEQATRQNRNRRIPPSSQSSLSPSSTIAQHIDYDFLLTISRDHSLVEEQVVKALNITLQYFMQINGDCFLQVLVNLLKFKESSQWCSSISEQILGKWTQIKLPPLESSIYKRKSPQEMCRFQAFGVKRREILRFQQYQKYKQLLESMCRLKDGVFLRGYGNRVGRKVQEINRSRDLGAYGLFLKRLGERIRLSRELLPEPVDFVGKCLVYRGEGMGGNNTIIKGIQDLEDEEQYQEEEDLNFQKLRDQVTESPIQHNRRGGNNGRGVKQLRDDDRGDDREEDMNEFLLTRNRALQKNGRSNGKSKGDDQLVQGGNGQQLSPTSLNNNNKNNNNNNEHITHHHQYIREFTSQQQDYPPSSTSSPIISLLQPQLQPIELTYISTLKDNNSLLLSYCSSIYVESMKERHDWRGLLGFLKELGVERYVGEKEGVRVWGEVMGVEGWGRVEEECGGDGEGGRRNNENTDRGDEQGEKNLQVLAKDKEKEVHYQY